MKILWLSWKDSGHPSSGGAEVVKKELIKRLVADGHEVKILAASFPGAVAIEERDGCTIIRLGNRYTVYWKAYRYYKQYLSDWPDIIIDEINTMPFFAKYYAKQPVILFVHQLAREIWFHEMMFPLSLVGYFLEPIYLRLLSNKRVVTISESTRNDLMRFGFKKNTVEIISEGIGMEPITSPDAIKKYPKPTILSLGTIRPMKCTKDIIVAFEYAKQSIPNLELILAGNAKSLYGQQTVRLAKQSSFAQDIRILGQVSQDKKIELMKQTHLLIVTSIKEGWGLVVTEANSQGTPAVVYDRDGLRDSVRHMQTGLISERDTPQSLADSIVLALSDAKLYEMLRTNAWKWSKEITFEKSYTDFIKILSDGKR